MAKARYPRMEDDDPIVQAVVAPEPGRSLAVVQTAPTGLIARFQAPRILEDAETTGVIQRVWGDALLAETSKVNAILQTQSVIATENGKMLQSAINIGRSLNDLAKVLTPEEFQRGLRKASEAFPGWSVANVTKLMKVAMFADEHQRSFSLNEAPQSYSVLYEFTTLDANQFERARAALLFRPHVRRSDVQAFKRTINALEQAEQHAEGDSEQEGDGEGTGQAERSPFAAEIGRIDQRLAALRREETGLRQRREKLVNDEAKWSDERRSRSH